MAPLAVSQDHILAAEIGEHGDGDFPRECSLRFVVAILRTDRDRRAFHRANNRIQIHGRRADRHVDRATAADVLRHGCSQLDRLTARQVHLPIARYQ
jgi:hypothetical protein